MLQTQQQEWQLGQVWLWKDHVWRGGEDGRVVGDGGVDVDGEGMMMVGLLWLMMWWMMWWMVKA